MSNHLQWLANLKCNSLSLTRDDDHACNYSTAKEWIEERSPDDFDDCPADLVQQMKDSNTIWRLQIYPSTPVGFVSWHGPTLESVMEQARKHFGDSGD